MAEKSVKPKVVTEPPPPPKEETQSEAIQEAYFFHPVNLSEETKEVLDEKEIEKSKAEIEQKLQDLLKSISEETLQLSEFLIEENNLTNELCVSLKQILKKLNVSFNIPTQNVPFRKRIRKIILNEEGHLIVIHEKGDVTSNFLADYSPEIVMAVMWQIMPELAKVIMLYRKKISTRVNFFGKVKKELKGVAKAIVGSKEEATASDGEQAMDIVKESIKSENQS